MRVILKRPRAADDLIELWDYIADDSVTRADAFIDNIDSKFHLLTEQPTCSAAAGKIWLQGYAVFHSVGT
jgi:plasmid stabilization system protein ParE